MSGLPPYYDNSADDDDDDDDYGGYFLRPVNEYKIADKIESANKELFDDKANSEFSEHHSASTVDDVQLLLDNLTEASEINQTVGERASSLLSGCQSLSVDSERSRRVTFRLDLEEFEPEFVTDNESASDTHADDSVSEISDDEDVDDGVRRAQMNNNVNASPRNASCEFNENNNLQTNRMNADRFDGDESWKKTDALDEPVSDNNGAYDYNEHSNSDDECVAEELEEICEVIEVFGLAEDPEAERLVVNCSTASTKIDHNNDDEKSSSSSVSDSEHSKITKPLSITNRSLVTSNNHRTQSNSRKQTPSQNVSKPTCKHPALIPPSPPHHHPSLSASSSGSNHSGSQPSSAGSNHTAILKSSADVLKIQLNFKPCCEYKHLETQRLPRYCGYLSQYGLSKEQLERREARRERYHNRRCKRIERQQQEESLKSRINEEAFESWLRLKMRSSRGGTRNMYDVVQQPIRGRLGRSRQF